MLDNWKSKGSLDLSNYVPPHKPIPMMDVGASSSNPHEPTPEANLSNHVTPHKPIPMMNVGASSSNSLEVATLAVAMEGVQISGVEPCKNSPQLCLMVNNNVSGENFVAEVD